MTDLHYNLYI